MRWKIKAPPKEGDWRCKNKFAWFPTRVEDHIVWLEFYFSKQHYIAIAVVDEYTVQPELHWVEYERMLVYNY